MKAFRIALACAPMLLVSGCPGDSCETDSDCGSGEMCTLAHTEDNPRYRYLCVTRDVKVGDRGGGYRVKEVQVGTGGVNITIGRDKED